VTSPTVTVELVYATTSLKALAFDYMEGPGIFWLPKSQMSNLEAIEAASPSIGDKVTVHIPQWLAEKHGLDPYAEQLEMEL